MTEISKTFRSGRTRLAAVLAGAAVCLTGLEGALAASLNLNVDERVLDRAGRSASYAPVVKKVAPSVVNIYSTVTLKMPQFRQDLFNDPFWRRFFGDDSDPRQRRPQTQKSQSLGSGVIVTEDGYILTNNHVVEGADKVEVALVDGKGTYTARVVGADPQTDVAVLKVEAKNLPALKLADSDKLEVGDVALALGNPFGVGQTVTMGIVSATGRSGFGVTRYEDWIQTDAAINPGNSGGALVDAEGRLIGINTFIVSRSGGSAGVGFAIPVNLARNVMEQLVSKGKIARGYLGVRMQPEITAQLAKQFNLPDQNGVLVSQVEPGTAAAEAGLKEGDCIIEFNGKKVTDNPHLSLMVSQTPPKTKVTLKVLRDGKEKTLTASLAELPAELGGRSRDSGDTTDQSADVLDGVEVADLDAKLRKQFDVPDSVKGAVVTNVEDGSAAAEAGLRAGDVILEINRRAVANADAAIEQSRKAKGDSVLLRVWGQGGTRYVVVENSKRK